MADTIKIGSLDISAFKVGSADCKIYLGDTLLYPNATPSYKLVAKYGGITEYTVECDGGTALTTSEVSSLGSITALTSAEVGACNQATFKVGDNAFSGATSLTSITIDDGVTQLGNQSFYGCSGLTSFTFPTGLTQIDGACFRVCNNITRLDVPNGVDHLGSGCFADMLGLTGATIPSSVTSIASNLFLRDSALKEVHFFGTTAPALGADAFKNTAIEKIYIPSCDCYDSYAATTGMSAFTNYIYGEDETKCKRETYPYRFKRISRGGSAYTLACDSTSAATVTSAQTRTGLTAAQLTGTSATQTPVAITFGDCCKTISANTCSGWTQLTSITISDSTTSIGDNALRQCVRVKELSIGSGIKTISNSQGFYYMGTSASTKPNLNLASNDGITISGTPFNTTAFNSVVFPKNSKIYGKTFTYSSLGSVSFGSGSKIYSGDSANNGAFYQCKIESSLNLNGVTSISDFAFSKCWGNGTATISVPSSVTGMGSYVFASGTSITNANVDCSGTLGTNAFIGCTSLSAATFGSHITGIGTYAFRGTSVKNVTVPDNVTSIGDGAFSGCTSLQTITLSNSITKISMNLFAGDSALHNVVVPSGVTVIDKGAFSGCSSMTSLTVLPTTPPSLEYIDAFLTMGGTIYVPSASLNAYKTASGWSNFASRIQAIPNS